MAESTFQRQLRNFFTPTTRAEWKRAALRETDGKDPDESLSWRGADGISFLPYYDAADISKAAFAHTQFLRSEYSTGQTGWANIPPVTATDPIHANTLALEALSSGADGILFDLQLSHNTSPKTLLDNIVLPYCNSFFAIKESQNFSQQFANFISQHYDPASVRGALFWESIPKTTNVDFFIRKCTHFRSLGVAIPTATPATEVADCLFRGAEIYDHFSSGAHDAMVMRSICFCLNAESSFLENIAKLRALRALWKQVAIAYGHHDYQAGDLYVHVRSQPVEDELYGPHENMLKGTFSAIAAVLGTCDGLSVGSRSPHAFTRRWAKNVSAILREESFLDQSADALAGSYAIEVMTSQVAQAAWQIFQNKCKAI